MSPYSASQTVTLSLSWHDRLRKRLFAAVLARLSAKYESLVVERKRALFADLQGDVLEIGPGTGANLAYYPPGIRWIGIEPNPYMHDYLKKQAGALGIPVDIRLGVAEQLAAADQSVDAVVSTLVLCSVADPARVLREIRRVLRPGGRFVFIEHTAAPRGQWLRRIQNLVDPLWAVLADGCHPNRETGSLLAQAGFARVHSERFRLPLGLVSPHLAGFAIK